MNDHDEVGQRAWSVGVCESQPATAEGIRSILREAGDLECRWSIGSLPIAMQLLAREPLDLVLLDKSFGLNAITEALEGIRDRVATRPLVWGLSMTEDEALRLVRAGARGILFKSADATHLLECLRGVASGLTYMDNGLFRERAPLDNPRHRDLTAREEQVLELVEQGKRNREIAEELSIRPGTVKIHLRHIFEKTGVRGRSGLALTGLRVARMTTLHMNRGASFTPEVAASA